MTEQAPRMLLAVSQSAISVSCERVHRNATKGMMTNSNIVLKLNSSGRVKVHLFQSLTNNIVRLALALLGRLDCGSLVKVAFIVDVKALKRIRQGKNFVLLKLRKFPTRTGKDQWLLGLL